MSSKIGSYSRIFEISLVATWKTEMKESNENQNNF